NGFQPLCTVSTSVRPHTRDGAEQRQLTNSDLQEPLCEPELDGRLCRLISVETPLAGSSMIWQLIMTPGM
ncbi:hypothetical protein CgunFtcFv8_027915, partial [Champsocephalus gunnari]